MTGRMPRYEVRNDGAGPYAIFYCDRDDNEYRSTPDLGGTIAKDIGRRTLGGFLRNLPVVGDTVADSIEYENPRYSTTMTQQQLDAAWNQVKEYFHECPTCHRFICPRDWDTQTGYCMDDSPRAQDIARAQAEQAGAMLKGFANAFGLGDAVQKAQEKAMQAQAQMPRCPTDGKLFPAGTKFCPEHGVALVQTEPSPQAAAPNAPAPMAKCPVDQKLFPAGTKFCPEHGAQLIQPS